MFLFKIHVNISIKKLTWTFYFKSGAEQRYYSNLSVFNTSSRWNVYSGKDGGFPQFYAIHFIIVLLERLIHYKQFTQGVPSKSVCLCRRGIWYRVFNSVRHVQIILSFSLCIHCVLASVKRTENSCRPEHNNTFLF